MAMRRVLPAIMVAALALFSATPTLAARLGSAGVEHAINHSPILLPTLLSAGGQTKWVVVSAKGPYAVASLIARAGHKHTFQPAIVLLKHRSDGWRLVADLIHQSCPGVPFAVRHDLRRYFVGPGRRLDPDFRGFPSSQLPGCEGSIASAR
jgi:hypothetical protein